MGDDNPVNSTSGDDDNPDNSTSGDDASSAPIVSCECSLLNPCFCQRDCVVCDNVAPPRGINNGMADGDDCYTAPPLVFERRCKNNDRWKQNQFCMLTCFNSGNSYLGVVCCNAPLPNLNMASLIKDGNPNPTTIVVTGAVDEAPNESISRSQVQRGIIIGTRMPSRFLLNFSIFLHKFLDQAKSLLQVQTAVFVPKLISLVIFRKLQMVLLDLVLKLD